MRKTTLFLLLLLTMPVTAQAAGNNFYWGIMVGSAAYEDPAVDSSLFAVTGRFGYELLPFLTVEGRLGRSNREPNNEASSINKLQIDYLANVSAKFNYAPSEKTNLYALAGISTYRMSFETAGDREFTDSTISYGVGIELFADGVNGINFEYVMYADDSDSGIDYELDHFGIGYVRRF